MLPKYYICKKWDPPAGHYRFVDLDEEYALVKVEDEHTLVQAGSVQLPHVLHHHGLRQHGISDEHIVRLSQHGVVADDTCFSAMMKVAANHPDMEP